MREAFHFEEWDNLLPRCPDAFRTGKWGQRGGHACFGLADRRGGEYARGMNPSVNRSGRAALGQSVLLASAWLLAGCDKPASQGNPGARSGSSPATAPLDYLAAQGQAKKHSEKVISMAQVQQALQQFQAAEDRWPRDLQELVRAGFLAAVPAAPAGQRVVYDPTTGTVRMVRIQP